LIETALSGELYTILTNKAAKKERKGTLVVMIAGTKGLS
jgi:hypothetical protein